MRLLIILGAALAGVLLFLLATASGNTSQLAQHYPLLLGLNAALADGGPAQWLPAPEHDGFFFSLLEKPA